jgi:hypothetical protein
MISRIRFTIMLRRVLEYAVSGFYRLSELHPVDFSRTKQERSTYSKVVQEGEHFSRHCRLPAADLGI